MLAIAVFVCSYLLKKDAARRNINADIIYDLVFWTVLSGIIGARIFYILLNLEVFLDDPIEIIMIQHGGLAYQGGFIFGLMATVIFLKKNKLAFLPMADLVAPYIALGHAIGRIGCFLNGCCYGRPVSWGIYVPGLHAHLHPTQLYEAVSLFIIFFILKGFRRMTLPAGQVFALYLVLAALERFVVENFRGDHDVLYWGFSIYQLVSLGIMAAGLALHVAIKFQKAGKTN